jgi:hypothetical protein
VSDTTRADFRFAGGHKKVVLPGRIILKKREIRVIKYRVCKKGRRPNNT